VTGHDYDPEWDYDLDRRPPKRVKEIVEHFWPTILQIAQGMELDSVSYYFIREKDNHLARYISGTSPDVVMVVNARAHTRGLPPGVELEDAIFGTLVHELAHGYVESLGIDVDHDSEELLVEQFAFQTWRKGDYREPLRRLQEALGVRE
jgi:hypothetical protein